MGNVTPGPALRTSLSLARGKQHTFENVNTISFTYIRISYFENIKNVAFDPKLKIQFSFISVTITFEILLFSSILPV